MQGLLSGLRVCSLPLPPALFVGVSHGALGSAGAASTSPMDTFLALRDGLTFTSSSLSKSASVKSNRGFTSEERRRARERERSRNTLIDGPLVGVVDDVFQRAGSGMAARLLHTDKGGGGACASGRPLRKLSWQTLHSVT